MQDAAGRSVLYLAAQKGHVRCVEVLLAQGASCFLNDNRLMWTPIHVAGKTLSNSRILQVLFSLLLLSSVFNRFSPAANGHSDCLRMMIDYGEEGDLTNVADKFGQYVVSFEIHCLVINPQKNILLLVFNLINECPG